MGKAPSAPNPATTISQQTASNKETAIAQAGLNYVNQVGPDGTLTYDQSGTWADGTPKYTATTSLSDAGKALQTTNEGTAQNLATLAQNQSGRLDSLLSSPLDFSQQKDYLEGLTSGALDKRWDTLGQQNETDLINRGIRPGSAQYDNLKNQFLVSQSDAYNSANTNNYNSALQSQLALRSQPLNEISALMGGSQVQTPQFGQINTPGIAGTDTAGITNAGYNQQMQQYNSGQSTLGGLFSAGASLIPMLSDRRAKTDIVRIGQTDAGTPIYKFRYKSGGPTQIGYMAQDLLETQPNAVSMGPDGFYRVSYGEVA